MNSLTGEKQAAEDLTQEAFFKVWRSAERYRAQRHSVRTWILSVVRNHGIDQLRARASRRRAQEKVEALAPRYEPSEAFAQVWHAWFGCAKHSMLSRTSNSKSSSSLTSLI